MRDCDAVINQKLLDLAFLLKRIFEYTVVKLFVLVTVERGHCVIFADFTFIFLYLIAHIQLWSSPILRLIIMRPSRHRQVFWVFLFDHLVRISFQSFSQLYQILPPIFPPLKFFILFVNPRCFLQLFLYLIPIHQTLLLLLLFGSTHTLPLAYIVFQLRWQHYGNAWILPLSVESSQTTQRLQIVCAFFLFDLT